MSELKQNFTSRQYMVNPDYEIFHYKDQPSIEVEYHNHDFYEIYFFISGKVNYIVEGKCYALNHDDILVINNKELHKPDIQKGSIYERIVLWVNPEFIKRLCNDQSNLLLCFEHPFKNKNNLLRPNAEILATIKNILNKLIKSNATASFGSDILNRAYLTELIIHVNRAFLEVSDDGGLADDVISNPKIFEIIQYINQHLHEDLSLENLSERVFISKYHLARQFKKYTGFTLYNYIQRKRLIFAKSLLKEDLNLAEVCQRCGFSDYSNFIRAFKNAYHLSPKKYARQNR